MQMQPCKIIGYYTPGSLRMRRYFRPRKDGSMQASSEALRMWRTESGRFLDLILGHHIDWGSMGLTALDKKYPWKSNKNTYTTRNLCDE